MCIRLISCHTAIVGRQDESVLLWRIKSPLITQHVNPRHRVLARGGILLCNAVSTEDPIHVISVGRCSQVASPPL